MAIETSKKRTVKACDRCKLKKVKCNGEVPCSRCHQGDAICHFGVSTSSEGKSVSASHVHQLQMHNEVLVNALRVMWDRYAKPILGVEQNREPSVHEIVKSLGVLRPGDVSLESLDRGSGDKASTLPSNHSDLERVQPKYESPDVDMNMNISDMDTSDLFQDQWSFEQPPGLISDDSGSSSASSSSSDRQASFSLPNFGVRPQKFESGLHRPNRPKEKLTIPPYQQQQPRVPQLPTMTNEDIFGASMDTSKFDQYLSMDQFNPQLPWDDMNDMQVYT